MSIRKIGQPANFRLEDFPSPEIKTFRHLTTCLPGIDTTSLEPNDLAALARHHGMCLNLLDWTGSPYVAAFFAYADATDKANNGRLLRGELGREAIYPPQGRVCIWRLGVHDGLFIKGEFEPHTTLSAVNYWQKAQNGMFTRLNHAHFGDIASYLEHRNLSDAITQFLIPAQEYRKALFDLEAMNITYATLFPDLRGAALQANIGAFWRILGGV